MRTRRSCQLMWNPDWFGMWTLISTLSPSWCSVTRTPFGPLGYSPVVTRAVIVPPAPRDTSMAASFVSTRNDGLAPTGYGFDHSSANADTANSGREKDRTKTSLCTGPSRGLYVG